MKRNHQSSRSAPSTKIQRSKGLLDSMKDPDLKVKEDDKIVVIKDKFPKAKYHYLILPRIDIPSIWHVTKEHQSLLMHMHETAENLTKQYGQSDFKIGYHAMPSMYRLHLHVISTDFISDRLKTKYHWNSFTTPFFLKSKDLCDQLSQFGQLNKISKEQCHMYLNTHLKCHKCSVTPKNMPELKKHLLIHRENNHI